MEQNNNEQEEIVKPAGRYLRFKPFAFLMMLFFVVLATAGLTIFALTFGEEKVVEVKVPVERAEFEKVYDAFDALKKDYYVEVEDNTLIEGAVNGMLDSLEDPYTDYMTVKEAGDFNESLSSSFQGIGAEVQDRNGQIMIVTPIKNSPAEKAGLLPHDIILSVDGENIEGKTTSEAVALIRGEKGTEVTLMIKRGDGAPIEVKIKRDDIPIETVYGEMLEDGIAHVQITSFSEKTAEELQAVLDSFTDMKGIVLDMRQNPGGYLDQAMLMASLFVEEGKPIYQIQLRNQKPEIFYAQGGKKYDVPVTVLIDKGSASASEIVAAALQESAGAKVIGEQSFGKGTMQTVHQFQVKNKKDGSEMKYTQGKWLTPLGNWINEKGIKPDVAVNMPTYASLPYVSPSVEMKEGMVSEQVKAVQEMLTVLGYEAGKIDGSFDEELTQIVKQFQVDQKLEQTGVITGDTTLAIMEQLREKIKTDDPQLKRAAEEVKSAK